MAPLLALGAVMGLAAGALGCGSSSEAQSPPLTKAHFIKQANSICEKSEQKQEVLLRAYEKKHPNRGSTRPWGERIMRAVGLPAMKFEIEEIAALSPPKGDEQAIEAIVKGLEKALKESEANPAPLLRGPGPLAGVERLISEYGFYRSDPCANPL